MCFRLKAVNAHILLSYETKSVISNIYVPNFKEVEEAYWFGPVCPLHCTRLRTVRDRSLKFYI